MQLSHPNLAELVCVGLVAPDIYYAYEDFATLAAWVFDPNAQIDQEECVGVLAGIVAGLEYLHEKGVAHGNLTLETVYLACTSGSKGYTPRLGHFGMAGSVFDASYSDSMRMLDTSHTPPRILRCGRNTSLTTVTSQKAVDHEDQTGHARSDILGELENDDIYQLGILIFETCTRRHIVAHLGVGTSSTLKNGCSAGNTGYAQSGVFYDEMVVGMLLSDGLVPNVAKARLPRKIGMLISECISAGSIDKKENEEWKVAKMSAKEAREVLEGLFEV